MINPLIAVVMGSDSDLPVMQETAKILEYFAIPYEMTIISAHRAPEKTSAYAKEAEERGIEVIIAAAGGAAHLAGVIASFTPLPVIGVPIQSGALHGVDALYAMVQMPPGIPVATVAVNGARNAGILAAQMLSIKDPDLRVKLKEYKLKLAAEVEAKAAKLAQLGYARYLQDI